MTWPECPLAACLGSKGLDFTLCGSAPGGTRALGLSTLDLILPSDHSTNVSCLDWTEL